ncbi:MAG: DUF6090 family protein [Bacteroidota bacterium]
MIKLFRKIRYNLMEKGKTSKYLKYAIGEIALVVIGILIALQINNWNSERINRNAEIKYLKGISSNLSNDLLELEGHFKTDTIKFDAYTYLIRAFNADTVNSNDSLTISSYYKIFNPNWFEGQNVVFDDLKSSGRINFISSESMKDNVQTYYRFFEETIKREEVANNVIIDLTLKNMKYFPVASFIEPTFEERWNGKTGSPNLEFTQELDFKLYKSNIIDNYSAMKAMQNSNHKARLELYHKGMKLKQEIEDKIKSEKK